MTAAATTEAGPTAKPTWRERARAALRRPFDDPNPILLKELRATFRTALFIRFLYLLTGFVGLFVLTWGAFLASGEMPPKRNASPTTGATAITQSTIDAYDATNFPHTIRAGLMPLRISDSKVPARFSPVIVDAA